MNTPSPVDPLRKRLRALAPPAADAALRTRLLADADDRLPRPAVGTRWAPFWRTGLAALAVVAVCAFGINEYLAWQEIQELAELDTLSNATMLLL